MKSNILHNLNDRLELYLRYGMTPKEAVDDVADKFGISKDGKVYEYLLNRAYESKNSKGEIC